PAPNAVPPPPPLGQTPPATHSSPAPELSFTPAPTDSVPDLPEETPIPAPVPIVEPEPMGLLFVPDTVEIEDEFIIRGLLFEQSQADLLPQSLLVLDSLYNVLDSYPTLRVEIRGFTSNEGSATRNQRLSEDRVRNVRRYLLDRGIARRRLEVRGFGESMPRFPNDTEENRRRNRRVEVRILKK
ncbi:MAG TPA: hypothetical protein DCE41_24460, partial [Cytophagales bacterium]|nr:hypothetical protein [Cytophagales bacterium]